MLLRQRIVFLGQEVDDQIANLIISQMLYLEALDPESDISLYINSPGGLAYGGMAIYDVIQHVRPDVSTICVGMGCRRPRWCSAGARPESVRVAERAHHDPPGQRRHARRPSDMEIQLREVMALTRRMAEIIAHHATPLEEVLHDIERDKFMTPEEALEYGLIDGIIPPRRGLALARPRASDPAPANGELENT